MNTQAQLIPVETMAEGSKIEPLVYDISAAISKGRRSTQEDAVAYGLHENLTPGFVVLADGMGGHKSGSTASGLVVESVHDALAAQLEEGLPDKSSIPDFLHKITMNANATLAAHVSENQETNGMGTTLVVPLLTEGRLHWISVGDSPLYLFRDNSLQRINEDHSFAPQLDLMVRAGQMGSQEALEHPDRSALTSALIGSEIPRIDYDSPPIELLPGDIIVASSDGLLYLPDHNITEVLANRKDEDSTTITNALMDEVIDLDHPDQDNISIVVMKVI